MDLAGAIIAAQETGPLFYLRGADTRGDLSERLNSAGIETTCPYHLPTRTPPAGPAALQLVRSEGPVVLPVFSPRSGAVLAQGLACGWGTGNAACRRNQPCCRPVCRRNRAGKPCRCAAPRRRIHACDASEQRRVPRPHLKPATPAHYLDKSCPEESTWRNPLSARKARARKDHAGRGDGRRSKRHA